MTKLKNKDKFERFLIIFMSFFIFAGYYVGLTIILATGNTSLSRFYSIPLRVLMLFFALLNIAMLKKGNIRMRDCDLLMLFLFILYTIKVLYTENFPFKTPLHLDWYEFILYFLFFNYSVYLFFRNINVKKYLPLIVDTLLFSGFVLGIVVILFYRDVLFSSQVGRFGATLGDDSITVLSPLAIAYSGVLNLSLLIPLFLSQFKKIKLIFKLYYIIVFLVSMFIFVMGATRGAFVVAMLSVALYIYFQSGLNKFKQLLYLLPLIPIFFLYLEYTGSSLLDRVSKTIENQESGGRDVLWRAAYQEFLTNPVLGGKIEILGFYPHNIIIEILMGMGVIGILIFIMLLFKSYKNVKLTSYTFNIFVIFINGFFQYMFSGAFYTAIILFFSIGLLNGYKYGK